METNFAPGTLVQARGREWVVLPDSTDDILMLRPLGGVDEEVLGISQAIEDVRSATFEFPNPERTGNYNACRLLRDAARISTRAAAGPFRSFGRIAVEPRPYQLVPLLMAMKLDPVRMLIADDVGIGKTIETCLIARELLDRGEVTRMAVLCPPHLAEQWQKELDEKFHISAELVLSSTVQRLERHCRTGESLFARHPIVVISTDFIKQARRKGEFIRNCPELVIVDEAHTCTLSGQVGRARQARFELLRSISQDENRHLLLVTATPHSGNEDAFRSLISLIDPRFAENPSDFDSDQRSKIRAELARHLIQRLRANIRDYLGSETSFPDREDGEESYILSVPYKALFRKVMSFASELVADESGDRRTQRVRWWSALALLRALASSPAAAASTLRNRAATADQETDEEVEEVGRRAVLDQDELEISEVFDISPGAITSEDENNSDRIRLRKLAADSEQLANDKSDAKLKKAINLIKKLIKEGHNPIVFCRFIDTADYVAGWLRQKIRGVEVASITGLIPPKEREDRIKELAKNDQRILVCTDCLSEGINLQNYFDAVLHYDLSWNPTRHEQREGRVDRFGQPTKKIRVITYFGEDNQIDGVVLDVLLRKHKKIKSTLGISVAVPGSSEEAINALFEGMQLRGKDTSSQMFLPGFDTTKEDLHEKWDVATKEEQRSRSRFAQLSIGTDEVSTELQSVRKAIGAGPGVEAFFKNVLHLAGVSANTKRNGIVEVGVSNDTARSLRHAIGCDEPFKGKFDLPVDKGIVHLSRTNPIVEGLASYVLESALDEVQAQDDEPIAQRCGLIRTDGVSQKTSLLLVRFRFHLMVKHRKADDEKPLLAEEIVSMAFKGTPDNPTWLGEEESQSLLDATPSANVPASLVQTQVKNLIGRLPTLMSHIDNYGKEKADELLDAHTRVRKSAKITGSVRVKPVLPADVLGCFVLLPENM